MAALHLVHTSTTPNHENNFLGETLELVNNLQITEQEGIDRVIRKLGEGYRQKIVTLLDQTRPKNS